MTERYDVLGIGAAVWDTLLVAPEYPVEDGKLRLDAIVRQGGGPTATALVACARLGLRAGYVGCVGEDENGAAILADFERYGVSREFARRAKGASSSAAFIVVNRARDTRTILHLPAEGIEPVLENAERAALARCRALHCEGRYPERVVEAARIVRAGGGVVSLDAGSVRDGMEAVMEETDLLLASAPFARAYTGDPDPERGAALLYERFHPRVALVTMGSRGGVWRANGESGCYDAFTVPVADTTGAGDVFHGAFLAGYLSGLPISDCARRASATAALKCSRVGGRAGIPTLEALEDFLGTDHA